VPYGINKPDARGVVAGLSISAPADRHKPGWAEALQVTAARIGTALGYSGDIAANS
jgi:DNA-binding IclR family transcriptional regulator